MALAESKRLAGCKFHRQHGSGSYFADFCCIERRLIIEIDGIQYAEPEEEQRDTARTAYLNQQSYPRNSMLE
ncbi:MAG: DUF559 domain-containing protein [Deltaproteobacteria bacterium]|nr:DUF559 domain-containing protein [Deltaproteobacteria bacterium]